MKRISGDFVAVRWTHVSLGTTLVAIAALVALSIVAAIRDVDSLAAIALALAILAFVIQIVVFIVQSWTTSQINAETHTLLSELRTNTRGTEKHLANQVEKLTDHLMGRQQQREKTGLDEPLDRNAIRAEVASFFDATDDSLVVNENLAPSNELSADQDPKDDQRARDLEELLTYPPEGGGVGAAQHLRRLSPLAVSKLKRFADDHRSSLRAPLGTTPGLPVKYHAGAPFDELKAAGLIDVVPWPGIGDRDEVWYGLTDDGREVARLLLARGPEPDWLIEAAGSP